MLLSPSLLLRRDPLSHPRSVTIQRRLPDQTATSSQTSTTCVNTADQNTCEKGTQVNSALPIALGICIPIIAIAVFILLHRQYRKRLRHEDKTDAEKYKSLDFGMDLTFNPKKNKKGKADEPPPTLAAPVHMRGLSIDPISSPFFLPDPKLDKDVADMDTGSLHEDRYHGIGPGRATPSRSQSRSNSPLPPRRAMTIESNSTVSHFRSDLDNANLLNNAQTNPTSSPPHLLLNKPLSTPSAAAAAHNTNTTNSNIDNAATADNPGPRTDSLSRNPAHDSYFEKNASVLAANNTYLQAYLQSDHRGNHHLESSAVNSSPTTDASSPASTFRSTSASAEDSFSQGTKTPLTSFSESSFTASFAGPETHSPLPIKSPATDPQPQSVEHKIIETTTSSYVNAHQSFGASVHMSMISAATSAYSDPSSVTPRASMEDRPPPSHHNPDLSMSTQSVPPGNFAATSLRKKQAPAPIIAITHDQDSLGNEFDFALESPILTSAAVPPPRGNSLAENTPRKEERTFSGDSSGSESTAPPRKYLATGSLPQKRMSVIARPLPPDEVDENPEERANRIRSFYKEYFDDSQAFTSKVPLPNQVDYYEDYGSEYQDNGTLYDPEHNGFVVAAPYAQPVTRRAMTPPPRAPPKFDSMDRSRMPYGQHKHTSSRNDNTRPPRNQSAMSQHRLHQQPMRHGRGRAPSSPAHYMPPGGHSPLNPHASRGPSAMSHRSNAPSQMSDASRGPKRPFAPPKDLKSIPTPSKLSSDQAIFEAADFAPPITFRDRQNGRRPDSPLGNSRPFSPSVRAFTPLGNSFDDLNVVPSPHALGQSGTFTNLDFAPPKRLRNVDSGSDASSIRSGGSTMSAHQLHHMRAGAYRLSRLPKGLAGTKQDIMTELKPSWNIGRGC